MGILQDGRILAASVAAGVLAGCYIYKKYRDNQSYWNSEFVSAGTVKDLYLYPIKSGKGLTVSTSVCSHTITLRL